MKIVLNDLFDYKNRFIYQLEDGFKFSLDSILLAEYVKLKDNLKILDMCSGNCAIPLILSTKTKSKIVAFEIQNIIAKLASDSVLYNKLEDQIKVINDDISNIGNYFEKEEYDIITCNPPYFKNNGNIFNKNPLRDRKLLLNKKEIEKLIGLTKQKGYALIPLNLYFKGNFVKLELGIGKGKKLFDKRQELAKKDAQKQIAINLKNKQY